MAYNMINYTVTSDFQMKCVFNNFINVTDGLVLLFIFWIFLLFEFRSFFPSFLRNVKIDYRVKPLMI